VSEGASGLYQSCSSNPLRFLWDAL